MDAHLKIRNITGEIVDINILDEKVLGFPQTEISSVSFSPYFLGNPYLEKGVAWNKCHPCFGSGSFHIRRNDGSTQIISPIVFTDENPTKDPNHFSGSEHWNIECWRYIAGETPKRVKSIPNYEFIHQFAKSDWIEIEASGSAISPCKYRINWQKL